MLQIHLQSRKHSLCLSEKKILATFYHDGNLSPWCIYDRWTSRGNCSCGTERGTSERNLLGRRGKKSSWHSPQREISVTFFWQASNKYSHRSILLIFPWQARTFLPWQKLWKINSGYISCANPGARFHCLSEAKGKESIKYSKIIIEGKSRSWGEDKRAPGYVSWLQSRKQMNLLGTSLLLSNLGKCACKSWLLSINE